MALRLRYQIDSPRRLREHVHLVDGTGYFFFPGAIAPKGAVASLEVDFSSNTQVALLRGWVWARASGGAIGAKHIRAIRPFDAATGWHWHDMTGHFVYVLRGWIKFRFAGVDEEIVVRAGSSLSQPAGVPHNVVGRSDDLELIEVNLPAEFGIFELAGPEAATAKDGR